eukprot:SAG11_NODE_724_length_7524_cov_6.241481_2_plen_148_part_00
MLSALDRTRRDGRLLPLRLEGQRLQPRRRHRDALGGQSDEEPHRDGGVRSTERLPPRPCLVLAAAAAAAAAVAAAAVVAVAAAAALLLSLPLPLPLLLSLPLPLPLLLSLPLPLPLLLPLSSVFVVTRANPPPQTGRTRRTRPPSAA